MEIQELLFVISKFSLDSLIFYPMQIEGPRRKL